MRTIKQFKRKPLASWIAMSLVSVSVAGGASAFAAPLAGTEIKNLATVSYEDENGNTYTAQSNEAVITVAPQYRATLENDRTQSSAPGQTAYFPHTLTNTGNTPDTYTLSTDTGDLIYLDGNSNGQPDPGEAPITSVTVAPGGKISLIVGHPIASTAVSGSSESVVLSVASASSGAIVKDIGANLDADTDDATATNNDVVNVTTGPVLVLNKQAVFDEANKKVTYTLTVKNTGGSDARLVDIIDGIPLVDHDNNSATPKLPLTNVTIDAVNGLLDTGDAVPTTVASVDETVIGQDLDGDGAATNTAVDAIKATDAVLAPNTTVSIVYSATYDPAWRAGAAIENTFITQADNDGVPGGATTTTTSNTTYNVIPQTYGALADDDSVNPADPSPGVNDGNDDDNAPANDTQLVDKVASGETVIFTHVVTNTGNGDDILNLAVTNTDFPAGTVFTLWNADGTVQLTDSDGDGIADSGVLGQNQSATIVVKAVLPAGQSGAPANGYNAVLTATSSGDSDKADTVNLKLGEITPPAVDLAAVSVDSTGNVTNLAAQASTGFNDGGTADAHDEAPVLFANDALIGSTVSFPMSIANESGSSDSFLLSYQNLPAGWSVVFKDDSNTTITSTPFLPAGGTFNYTAYVTVSSDPAQAYGNSPRAGDVDGYDAIDGDGSVLTGTDGDNDYVIEFVVTSAADSTRTDSIQHGVDVKSTPAISITPDGQNQVQPGGTVDYPHKLVNDGNIDEAVEIIATNSDTDWNSTTLVDTTGDGAGDTELVNLTSGAVIKVYNPDGSTANATLTDSDGDGIVEFPLQPGQYVKLTNKVFAPADAPQGEVNATQLNAQDPGVAGTVRNTATDTSNVILGQVRLDKTVALQTDCTDPSTIGSFAEIQSAAVEPGQCAVWQIVAKNEGDALVKNVVVNDNVPAYTTSLANSLLYCKGFGCTPAAVTDTAGDDAGEVVNDLVTFYLGDNSTPANKLGGELQPGESSTVRFTVKIDE